jgi:hypothetical protein
VPALGTVFAALLLAHGTWLVLVACCVAIEEADA